MKSGGVNYYRLYHPDRLPQVILQANHNLSSVSFFLSTCSREVERNERRVKFFLQKPHHTDDSMICHNFRIHFHKTL